MQPPKISVCVPTRDRKRLLKEAVESILNQSFDDFELVVCDDGSVDGTPEYVRSLRDSRLRYVRHEVAVGKSNNMRAGFHASRGEYFVKLDDDDRLTTHFLTTTSQLLDSYSTVDFVSTDHWIIDDYSQRDVLLTEKNSRFWGRCTLPEGVIENMLHVTFVSQSLQIGSTMFRRQSLVDVDFVLPDLQNCEDVDLFLRLALAGKVGYYLPERLMEYRIHSGQQGLQRAIKFLRDKVNYLQRYYFEDPQMEKVRVTRARESQLLLGIRLIRSGADTEGRMLVWQAKDVSPWRAVTALCLSLVPVMFRDTIVKSVSPLCPTKEFARAGE